MRFKEFKIVTEKIDSIGNFRSSFSDVPGFSDIILRGVSTKDEPEGDGKTPGQATNQGNGYTSDNDLSGANVYTVGDSHAVAIATHGGKGWVSKAIGGKTSIDKGVQAAVNEIPTNSIIVVSAGANDAANNTRRMQEGERYKTPEQIAADVASLVALAKTRSPYVYFVLFPNGTKPDAPGIQRYYSGKFTEKVRAAIKSAINVPMFDLNGATLYDGVHANAEGYKSIASQIRASLPKPKAVAQTNKVGSYSSGGTGLGETGNAKEAVQYFISKGWTPAQAAGIVGNLQAESGANLQTNAVGDGGQAYGIAQWHPDRQANFKRAFGKDIRQSRFKEQLAFVQWELENTESRAAAELRKATTPQQAAAIVDQFYERSSGAHRGKRIANAQALVPSSSTRVA